MPTVPASAQCGATAPILTHRQARALLDAAKNGAPAATLSLDLGRTETTVPFTAGVPEVGGAPLAAGVLAKIASAPNKCFRIVDGEARPMVVFSASTGWVRTLWPTADAPTTVVAGFPMHRVQGTTPLHDSRAKVRALGRPRGRVLDTATGLGYTAIELAQAWRQVDTVEIDPAALELARLNPWSRPLFERGNITLHVGDAVALTRTFETGVFAAVLHDPPTLPLAGALYAGAFYAELRRILKPRGRLFHYVGDPDSRAGARATAGVLRRLAHAGFENVRRYPRAFGVTAVRPARS